MVDSLDALGSKKEAFKNSSNRVRLEAGTLREIEAQETVS